MTRILLLFLCIGSFAFGIHAHIIAATHSEKAIGVEFMMSAALLLIGYAIVRAFEKLGKRWKEAGRK